MKGAAFGMGLATAEAMRDAGADVLAVDRSAEGLATLGRTETRCVNLADDEQRATLIEEAAGSRSLVNAAGPDAHEKDLGFHRPRRARYL